METGKELTFRNVDEYLAQQPAAIYEKLTSLRDIIRKTAPQAEEFISYQMPAYKQKGIIAFFAAFTKHYSLFLKPHILNVFRDRLSSYKMTKSAINIPLDTQLPEKLVVEMISFALADNQMKFEEKKKAKNKK
jgi:uncharacterized protein YdhG (YjbR/CyaY superfamily)